MRKVVPLLLLEAPFIWTALAKTAMMSPLLFFSAISNDVPALFMQWYCSACELGLQGCFPSLQVPCAFKSNHNNNNCIQRCNSRFVYSLLTALWTVGGCKKNIELCLWALLLILSELNFIQINRELSKIINAKVFAILYHHGLKDQGHSDWSTEFCECILKEKINLPGSIFPECTTAGLVIFASAAVYGIHVHSTVQRELFILQYSNRFYSITFLALNFIYKEK